MTRPFIETITFGPPYTTHEVLPTNREPELFTPDYEAKYRYLSQAQVLPPPAEPLPPNPKAAHGAQKPDLSLIPGTALVAMALAFEDGARKYGAFNWRVTSVEAMTYVAAQLRHITAWADGDEHTTDTGVPNLGAVMACCAILIDAASCGRMIDNRPVATGGSAKAQDRVKASRAK